MSEKNLHLSKYHFQKFVDLLLFFSQSRIQLVFTITTCIYLHRSFTRLT